jgi:eukaryotic-like serine/threonine-protein kinase
MGAAESFFTKIGWEKTKYIIVPILIIFVIYIFLNDFFMPWYTRHGQAIEVPNVVEMTYEGARTLLDKSELQIVEKEKKFDLQFRAGTVISQNPRTKSLVKKGRRVYVIVSKGDPSVEMPKLISQSEKNAIFEISRQGLQSGNVSYEHSSSYPEGVVINQSIPAGDNVKVGEVVDIVVSLGQFPDRFIVPSLVGRSLKDARKIIMQAGLTFGNVSYQVMPDLLPETVIDQSLQANTEVTQGASLNLLISSLPTEEEKQQ